MGMRELSDHILSVARQNNRSVTNLQLQKVLFFTLGLHMRRSGEIDALADEIYDIPFQKWKYGPVVEGLYYDYNLYGSRPINLEEAQQHEEYNILNNYILNLLDVDVFKLVQMSHQFPSWNNYEDQIINMAPVPPYELTEIFEDFSQNE
ncbi:Panacea domain-containing protein [Halobacillus faecis]